MLIQKEKPVENHKNNNALINMPKQKQKRDFPFSILYNIETIEDDLLNKIFTLISYLLFIMLVLSKILLE